MQQAVSVGTDITASPAIHRPRLRDRPDVSFLHYQVNLIRTTDTMAAPLHSTARRSVTTIASAALKAPTRRSIATSSALQRRALSATSRGLNYTCQSPRSLAPTCQSKIRSVFYCYQQVRWNSDESAAPVFRQWGFEEVSRRFTIPLPDQHYGQLQHIS